MEVDTPTQQITTYENTSCLLCGGGDDANVLLLCDGCDKGFHTYCINLPAIPVGAWYCPACRKQPTVASSAATTTQAAMQTQVPNGTVHPNLRVVFYERVSSKGQNEPEYGRVGMNTQNNTLLEFACKNGLIVCGTYQEVHSARNPSQLSQLARVITQMKATGKKKCDRVECLVVYSVSRFSRNLAQGRQMVENIHAAGGWVWSVSDHCSSYEERFLKLLESAQMESDMLSQKIKDAYARVKAHGGHIGPAPFGWTTYHDQNGIRRLMTEPGEQQILVKLRQIYDRNEDPAQIAQLLNGMGIYRRGKLWTRHQIVKSLGTLTNNSFSKDMLKALDEEDDACEMKD